MLQEFVDGQPDVFENLAEQNRRDVSAGTNMDSGSVTVRVPELLVGTTLAKSRRSREFRGLRGFLTV